MLLALCGLAQGRIDRPLAEWADRVDRYVSAATYMLVAAIRGRASDLRGRRFVLAIGMMGFGLGALAFAGTLDLGLAGIVMPSLALVLLIAVRVGQSVVSAGAFPAAQAHIAENSMLQRHAVALSAVTSAFALGNVLGPALAAVMVMIWITLPLYDFVALSIATSLWMVRDEEIDACGVDLQTAPLAPRFSHLGVDRGRRTLLRRGSRYSAGPGLCGPGPP